MNKQRKVLITTTYNEMGIIIDTKAEELDLSAQPNLQPTCNNLATDTISRQATINALIEGFKRSPTIAIRAKGMIEQLPSAQSESNCFGCKHVGMWEDEVEYGSPFCP